MARRSFPIQERVRQLVESHYSYYTQSNFHLFQPSHIFNLFGIIIIIIIIIIDVVVVIIIFNTPPPYDHEDPHHHTAAITNNEIGTLNTILTSYFAETVFRKSNTAILLATKGRTKAGIKDNWTLTPC